MSYDLMVFDPAAAPCTREAFHAWFRSHSTIEDDLPPSDDPGSLTPALQAWFAEMIKSFPPLNGPLASGNVDDPNVTDYGLARTYVYACFGWSQQTPAFKKMFKLAEKHRVGFFNVSSNESDVWLLDHWADSVRCENKCGASQPGRRRTRQGDRAIRDAAFVPTWCQ